MKSFIFKHLISKLYKTYFSLNLKPKEFAIKKNSRCLLLSPHADDETIGCGGTILQHPENFDVYCLTNGFKGIDSKELSPEEKVAIRKKEFIEAMEKASVNYYHFFEDIDDKRLIMRFDRFKTISLTDYDYIFIPNILDQHRDHKAVAILLNELLKERPYKKDVKILMYEVWSALALPNAFVDIEDTMDAKLELLKTYKSQNATRDYLGTIEGLNRYRGLNPQRKYVEAFCMLDIEDFKKLCKMYSM